MNWAEEKFVKLFTRDTPTWLAWPWQARAMAPLLLRKLEGEGRLAVGRLEPARAAALTIGLPIEVVEAGLPAMLDDGTLELRDDGLWWSKFEEAQESRKSDALRQREQRAKQRRDSSTPTRHTASHAVTPRHSPEQNRTEQTRDLPTRKKPRAEKSVDPRHVPMRTALIETFRRKRGIEYPFDYGREDAEVRRLLKLGTEPVVTAAWERALDSQYPTISTLAKFRMEFPRFVGRGETTSTAPAKGAAWTNAPADTGKGFLEGLES